MGTVQYAEASCGLEHVVIFQRAAILCLECDLCDYVLKVRVCECVVQSAGLLTRCISHCCAVLFIHLLHVCFAFIRDAQQPNGVCAHLVLID